MKDERKEQLIQLGADVLAETLVELAESDDSAADIVERLLAPPAENATRFSKKLTALKSRRHFYTWRETSTFINKLESILADIQSANPTPEEGVEMVLKLFDADGDCFEQCDDSDGDIGGFFKYSAAQLFVEYAQSCSDQSWVSECIFQSVQNDGYGVRDVLLDRMIDCVSAEVIRSTINQLLATPAADEYERRRSCRYAETLAWQLKDAPLFEELREKGWSNLNAAAWIDIARVYFESGDPKTALERLSRIAPDDTFHAYERDRLLAEIYQKTGDKEPLAELLKKNLRKHHTVDVLNELLDVIGHDRRDEMIQEEVSHILQQSELNHTDIEFLLETGHVSEAEEYVLKRSAQLDGDFYTSLRPLAKQFETAKRPLAAALIYRALLNSILDRGYSTAYSYAARYLKKLDALSLKTRDWQSNTTHEKFKSALSEKHKRKRAFWAKYDA
jgi:thioredoxin-like negative regulator of GroEL